MTTLKAPDVPRNVDDRQTVLAWQQTRDALNQHGELLEFFTEDVHILPNRRVRAFDAAYSPVGLWSFDVPPGAPNIPDQSGNGNNLVIETGTLRTSAIDPSLGGVFFDGSTNFWVSTTPAVLRLLGAMTVIVLFKYYDLTANRTIYSHGANGATSAQNTLYSGGIDTAQEWIYKSEHGSKVLDSANTLSTQTRNDIGWVGITRSAGGVLKHWSYGIFAGGPFGTVTLPTDGSLGHLRIGADQNGSFKFGGVISSVAIYGAELTAAQMLERYNYSLGAVYGYKSLTSTVPPVDDWQPVMQADEDLELVSATLTLDQLSGNFAKTDIGIALYRLDVSGSISTNSILASIDPAASSAKSWTPFRANDLRLAGQRPTVKKGETIVATGKTAFWSGNLSMRFRRLVS